MEYKKTGFSVADSHRVVIGLLVAVFLVSLLIFIGCMAIFSGSKAQAATSSNLNFQARLQTAAGGIVADGNYNIEFKLYDAVTSAGSSQGSCSGDTNCKWTETRTGGNTVSVKNGYLTVNLGSVTALPAIDYSQELWLTLRVGGTGGSPTWDPEMSPRLQLTAVPYAFEAGNSAKLGGLTAGGFIQNTTSLQTAANLAIQSAADANITGLFQGRTTQSVATLRIKQGSAQSGNALEVVDSSNVNLFKIDQFGGLVQAGPAQIAGFTGIGTTASSGVRLRVDAAATGNIGLIVTGSGVDDVAQFDGSNGRSLIYDAAGTLNLQGGTTQTTPNLLIKQGSSQTGDLLRLQDPGNALVTSINQFGQLEHVGQATFDSIVGIGNASASTTNTYLRVQNAAGTKKSFEAYGNFNQTADIAGLYSGNTSGTITNNFLVSRDLSGGTTTNGIAINQTAGTLTNGLAFSGTIGTDIQRSSGTLSLNGAAGINLQTNGATTASLSGSGAVLFKNSTNSTTAFQVQPSGSTTPVFNVDTTNSRVGIGTAAPSRTFDVAINNSQVAAPMALLEQAGTGDAGLELKNSGSSSSFYLTNDASNSNAFVINSYTAATAVAPATIAHVQSNSTFNALSTTAISQAFGSNNAAGNLIVASVIFDNTNTSTATCSDTRGNSYSQAFITLDNVNHDALMVCYAPNSAAGANTVTVTFGGTSGGNHYISVHEYSGAATSSPLDMTSTNLASGTTATDNITSGSVTTNQNGELIFGSAGPTSGPSTMTAGTGFTQRASQGSFFSSQDRILATGGSVASTNTFGTARTYLSGVATFKANTSGGSLTDVNSNPLFTLTATGALKLQGTANSAAALGVSNYLGASIFAVDTANAQIVLGQGSIASGKLVLNNATNNNTVSIQSGVTSASYSLTLPTAAPALGQCLQNDGTTVGQLTFSACGGSLQTGYTASTGGTTPEIKLDATRGGLDIQDANSSIAANLLTVRASNGAGLGSALFGIGATGQTLFQNSANSTTAFQIQNAAGTSNLLVVDSLNTRVGVGKVPTTTFDVNGSLNSSGGAVTLAGTGASSLTSTAGLTLTGAAASTWSTSAGLLTITGAGGATITGNTGVLTVGNTTLTGLGLNLIGPTYTNAQRGITIGTADANITLLDLDQGTSITAETTANCTTTINAGGLYYNSNAGSAAIRTCVNGGWEDVVTSASLGILAFGVVQDSGTNPGDLVSIVGTGTGPCKVIMGGTTSTVSWTACTAYSGGRKVVVAAGTVTTTNAVANNFQHLCLTGTNSQPALTTSAAENAGYPTFSATAPILCIADVTFSAANNVITRIYDTRVFTTSTKQYANIVTTAPTNGTIVKATATNGQYTPTLTTDTTAPLIGVVAVSGNNATANTINAIIVTAGPTYVKAFISIANQFLNISVTKASYAESTTTSPTTAYTSLGITTSTNSLTCTINADNCRGSAFTTLNIR